MSVRVDDELARRFETFARENGLTDSDALRTLLAWSLERSGDPRARAALAIQSQVCAQLTREHAASTDRILRELRQMLPAQ